MNSKIKSRNISPGGKPRLSLRIYRTKNIDSNLAFGTSYSVFFNKTKKHGNSKNQKIVQNELEQMPKKLISINIDSQIISGQESIENAYSDLKIFEKKSKNYKILNSAKKNMKLVAHKLKTCVCGICECGGCRCDLPRDNKEPFFAEIQECENKTSPVKTTALFKSQALSGNFVFPKMKYSLKSTHREQFVVPSSRILNSSLFTNFEIRRTLDPEFVPIKIPLMQKTSYTRNCPISKQTQVVSPIKPVYISDVDSRLPFFLVRKIKNYGENAVPEFPKLRKRKKSANLLKNLVFGSFYDYSSTHKEHFKTLFDVKKSEICEPKKNIFEFQKGLIGPIQYKKESQNYGQGTLKICPARSLINKRLNESALDTYNKKW